MTTQTPKCQRCGGCIVRCLDGLSCINCGQEAGAPEPVVVSAPPRKWEKETTRIARISKRMR